MTTGQPHRPRRPGRHLDRVHAAGEVGADVVVAQGRVWDVLPPLIEKVSASDPRCRHAGAKAVVEPPATADGMREWLANGQDMGPGLLCG